MIVRTWRSWTRPENADVFEKLMRRRRFPEVLVKRIAGLVRIELDRVDLANEVEFVVTMWFAHYDAVRAYAGENYQLAVVPAAAAPLLERYEPRSEHYEIV